MCGRDAAIASTPVNIQLYLLGQYLSACQPVSLSVPVCACQSVSPSVCQPVSLSVPVCACQSVSLSACQPVSLSACQSGVTDVWDRRSHCQLHRIYCYKHATLPALTVTVWLSLTALDYGAAAAVSDLSQKIEDSAAGKIKVILLLMALHHLSLGSWILAAVCHCLSVKLDPSISLLNWILAAVCHCLSVKLDPSICWS